MLFADLFPRTIFFDSTYLDAFQQELPRSLDSLLKGKEGYLNSWAPSESDQTGEGVGDSREGIENKREYLPPKICEGLVLDKTLLSQARVFSRRAGLGKIYLLEQEGIGVGFG